MPIFTKRLQLETEGNAQVIHLTPLVDDVLQGCDMDDGLMTLFVPGATGGITTVEYEPGLVQDLDELWERLIPQEMRYHHNEAWGDGNGHSHLRASLLGPSLSIPFENGKLLLGRWQEIIFIDFDVRPRHRELIAQYMGD